MPRKTFSFLLCIGLIAGLSCESGCNPAPPPPSPGPGPMPSQNVDIARELMVTDLSVVNSSFATDPDGPWTFGRLFRDLSPTDANAKAMLLAWLGSWETVQTFNGDTVPRRPDIRDDVINPWKARDGQRGVDDAAWIVNWDNAPFRLMAIVNRIDLRRGTEASPLNAGEGRFVFCFFNAGSKPGKFDVDGSPKAFTIIFEYEQLATTHAEVLIWAQQWHALGALPFGDQYNQALRQVTDRFAVRGGAPLKPGTSALNQLRTNEIAIKSPWEMREFNLVGAPATLRPVTVKQTPRNQLDGTPELAAFVAANADALKQKGGFFIDPETTGVNFLGAASQVPLGFVWNAKGITDSAARHSLAFQACNGCHHKETGVSAELDITKPGRGFTHIAPRARNKPSKLSGFLTGVKAPDPVTGVPRPFNDLESRARGPEGLEKLLGIDKAVTAEFIATPSQETRQVRVH